MVKTISHKRVLDRDAKIDNLNYCHPMGEWVLIKLIDRTETTDNRIIVPDFVKNKGDTQYAIIVESGKGRRDMWNVRQPNGVEAADFVCIDSNAPKLSLKIKKVEHYLISAANIVGVISGKRAMEILKLSEQSSSKEE